MLSTMYIASWRSKTICTERNTLSIINNINIDRRCRSKCSWSLWAAANLPPPVTHPELITEKCSTGAREMTRPFARVTHVEVLKVSKLSSE